MLRLLLLTVPLLLCACGRNQSPSARTKYDNSSIGKDTLQYSYFHITEVSPYLVSLNKKIDTAFYKISFPKFAEERINSSIQKAILVDGDETPEDAAQNFIAAYNEFAEDNSTKNIHTPWFKEINTSIKMNTPLFLAIQTKIDEYTGGAHGNHYTLYANYDVLKAEKIQLQDIIKAEQLDHLTKIAEKHFRKIEKLKDTASLAKDFFFEDGIFTLNDNFGLTKQHLVVFYNEYEIKPYAKGTTQLEIPYSELKDILNIRGIQYIESIN